MLTIDFWQLAGLLVSVFTALVGVVVGVMKMFAAQVQQSLDRRFQGLEGQADAWQNLEREFLRFQATIAVDYVRREDYVRGQSVIESKLDAIAGELKRVQIEGMKQGKL